jgi:hypothetical protein
MRCRTVVTGNGHERHVFLSKSVKILMQDTTGEAILPSPCAAFNLEYCASFSKRRGWIERVVNHRFSRFAIGSGFHFRFKT